jgi:ribosomal protein L24
LNQLIINRLVKENKFLKEELEIAKSNILILEEKESQYKDTIEHINVINKEKEISYKNIMCLINNYKNRENQFNYKLSLYSKELMKKNKIIKELNTKINELKERIISLKNILSEKNRIINYM